jgi:hypothetical protein
VLTATNKWLLISESHDDSNQCIPCRGKPDTHDMYASRANPHTPPLRILWAVLICGNISRWPNRVGQTLLLTRKMAPDTIYNTLTDWSTGPPPSFSPNTTVEAVIKAKHLLTTGYISLLGPYLQYVISTFNTCSWGPTHWSLTDIDGGYNLGDVGFPYHTP